MLGDTAALRALVASQLARYPRGPIGAHLRWRARHLLKDSVAFPTPDFNELDTDANLRWMGIEAQDYAFAMADGLRAVELRLRRPGIPDALFERWMGVLSFALNLGRPARDALEAIDGLHRDSGFAPRLTVLTALYADGDTAAAESAASRLAAARSGGSIGDLNRCVVAQWRLSRREPHHVDEGAPRSRERAPAAGDTPLPNVVCEAVLAAQRAAGQRDPAESRAARAHLDSLLGAGRITGLVDDGHTEYAHLALARLEAAAGDPARALTALRRRSRYNGWQPYLATMLRLEGLVATAAGDTAAAIRAYEHYLAFRSGHVAPPGADVRAVQGWLARLRAGRE